MKDIESLLTVKESDCLNLPIRTVVLMPIASYFIVTATILFITLLATGGYLNPASSARPMDFLGTSKANAGPRAAEPPRLEFELSEFQRLRRRPLNR